MYKIFSFHFSSCFGYHQVLVPVPQYPLYSAAITLFGGSLVPYYLEETANWGLDLNNLRQSVAQARSKGITVSMLFLWLVYGRIQGICFETKSKLDEWMNRSGPQSELAFGIPFNMLTV